MTDPALVQSNPYVGTGNTGAYVSAQTAGNTNVIIVIDKNVGGASTLTVSDSANGAYTLVDTLNDNAGFEYILYIFVRKNIAAAGAGTNTVTLAPTNLDVPVFWATEWSNLAGDLVGSGAVGTDGGTPGTALATSSTVTTTAPHQLAISWAFADGQGYTPGAGWTLGDSQFFGVFGWEYQTPPGSGAVLTGTATQTSASDWVIGLSVLTVPASTPNNNALVFGSD